MIFIINMLKSNLNVGAAHPVCPPVFLICIVLSQIHSFPRMNRELIDFTFSFQATSDRDHLCLESYQHFDGLP